MSFSVGTMIVVAVAMIGSLTVLPAVLVQARRQGREGPHPVHSGRRAAPATVGIWGVVVDARPAPPARLGRRGDRAAARAGRSRRSACTPRRPASRASRARPSSRSTKFIDAFPGTPDPAVVAIKADDVNSAAAAGRDRRAEDAGASPRRRSDPRADRRRRSTATGTVARVEVPLAGNGTDDESNAALGDPARRADPADRRQGRRRRGRRHRRHRQLAGLQRRADELDPAASSASCCCSRSGCCSSRSARS